MKRFKTIFYVVLLGMILWAGCGKDTPEVTITTAPTVTEKPTPVASEPSDTPTPTAEPTAIPAPFAMVSPVPQSEVVDITGTMTIDTYPVVDGSTATLPLSEAVFMAATGESAEVAAQQVVHTKTTNSYNRLYNGEVDLLIVYEPAESIVERMKTEPLCIKPIGLDALVFLANTANPLESLTMEQLVDIYSGKVVNWAEIGGTDKELLAFQRPTGSGSQTLMQKLVMGDVAMVDGDNVFRYSTMSDILEGMLSYNNEDNTLGYSVFYYANNMYFEKDLKLMGVDGVIPSTKTIYDGSYKLTNAFYAVVRTDEPMDSNAKKLFDWLTGEAGQQLVLDLGYVPVQMPAGADISEAAQTQTGKVEILAEEPLEEGQYFIFFNPQNMTTDYYYGDMTVYDHNWEELANFYNVALNRRVYGIYTNRYLPVGQIRQNAEGEQVARYGIFDLEQGEYAIAPTYKFMEILDVEQGYYVIPPENEEEEYSWLNWRIINGTGEVLKEQVEMSDWLMMFEFGNGYLEYAYDYVNWDGDMFYRYYDKNLNLKYVYVQNEEDIPDDADKIAGAEYILMDTGGCLVNADGEVVLNWAAFLDKFGDGENMNCRTQFSSVTLAEENACYPVLYQKKIYLVDSKLNLLRIIENPVMLPAFDGADFYENFCYYMDNTQDDWVYRTYAGEPLLMSDGMLPDEISKNWDNNGYLMYRAYNGCLFLEEYTENGELIKFSIELKDSLESLQVSYSENGYVMVGQYCGEQMPNPYQSYDTVPVYENAMYYRGRRVSESKGMNHDYIYDLDENRALWVIQNGNRMISKSESIFEDYVDTYALAEYVMVKNDVVTYEINNAYLITNCNQAAFFLQGNYVYAVGYDGTEYIRALHNFMTTD